MKKFTLILILLFSISMILTACAVGEKKLSISCVTDPRDYRPGDQVAVRVQVENIGRTFRWYGDEDSVFGEAELRLNAQDLEYTIGMGLYAYTDGVPFTRDFQRGQVATETYHFDILEDAQPGSYNLIVRVFGEEKVISNAVTILPAETASDPVEDTDPQLLTAAKAAEIENAWYTVTGVALGDWCVDAQEEYLDGVRYYGSYGGYDILFRPTGDEVITNLEIQNMVFSHYTAFEILAYREGEFIDLQEVCASGLLTDVDLEEISQLHLTYQSRVVVPVVPDTTLNIQTQMRMAFLEQVVGEGDWTVNDLSVTYYGEFSGAHVGFINGILAYTQAFTSETVGNVTFRYSTGQRLQVYYEGEIMGLSEAYTRGILTQEDLVKLRHSYAPQGDNSVTE